MAKFHCCRCERDFESELDPPNQCNKCGSWSYDKPRDFVRLRGLLDPKPSNWRLKPHNAVVLGKVRGGGVGTFIYLAGTLPHQPTGIEGVNGDTCRMCGVETPRAVKGLCVKCYSTEYRRMKKSQVRERNIQ